MHIYDNFLSKSTIPLHCLSIVYAYQLLYFSCASLLRGLMGEKHNGCLKWISNLTFSNLLKANFCFLCAGTHLRWPCCMLDINVIKWNLNVKLKSPFQLWPRQEYDKNVTYRAMPIRGGYIYMYVCVHMHKFYIITYI